MRVRPKAARRITCCAVLIFSALPSLAFASDSAGSTEANKLTRLREADAQGSSAETQDALLFDGKSIHIIPRGDVLAGAAKVKDLFFKGNMVGLGDPTVNGPGQSSHSAEQLNPAGGFTGPTSDTESAVPADGGLPALGARDAAPSFIVNGESRYPITNTTTYSASSFAFLEGSKASCSGVYYGPRWLVTAGHCVLLDDGTYNFPMNITRGRNGSQTPYGICHAISFSLAGWTANGNAGDDYAMIQTDCSVPGTYGAGFEPVVSWNGGDFSINGGWVSGYPGDHPYGTLWEDTGSVTSNTRWTWRYLMDMTSGQSGGPTTVPCGPFGFAECLVGVNSREQNRIIFAKNVSKRFTDSDIATLAYIRDTYP